jgi:UDP-hydrolysing UDP-N-acetyl-D-glucosamine 2-epimerase
MKTKRKICAVLVNRANYGRIKSALKAIKEHPNLELSIVATSSMLLHRFGEAYKLVESDGLDIDAKIYTILEGETPTTMAKSTGLALLELPTVFSMIKPDIVLTVADRYETLATAIAASYTNTPLAHTQGGEVTGSIDESVRHAVTKLAHIHFPATEQSARRIVQMGEDPSTVFNVGCPSIDVIASLSYELDGVTLEKLGGIGGTIDPFKPYLLVLQHPVTTEFGDGFSQIRKTLNAIKYFGLQAVILWPNADAGSEDVSKGIRFFIEENDLHNYHFYRNLPVEVYAKLLKNCTCIVGNSSSGIRESAFLGVPAVNIGTRQAGRERGKNVIDVGYDEDEIKEAIRTHLSNGRYEPDYVFGQGDSGRRIADILAHCEIKPQKKFHDLETINWLAPRRQSEEVWVN